MLLRSPPATEIAFQYQNEGIEWDCWPYLFSSSVLEASFMENLQE